jgi:hypothetical protein
MGGRLTYASLAHVAGQINLQATLSASSAGSGNDVTPHHPITCTGELEVDLEAGEFRCPHAGVPLADERAVYCLQHSVAILLIEMAVRRFG